MPGKVKVKILAGRNLPVMDRSSDTTDAYVEIKLGNTTYKTEVCRKSLNPVWDSEWYRYEVDDSELQDEPLQIRLMDYDTYSANDSIGKVYLDLNPLLLPPAPSAGKCTGGSDGPPSSGSAPGGTIFSGWIPVFDTMHGIRGEVNIIVKVELFSDFNKFRQSSCGVQFFCSPVIPCGYHVLVVHGFVEELVVNDDPEYQWIDKIRTPRASNEARQTLFFKLSGELQRKIGLKALDLGGNAVIGYNQCFDLEGESGIVVRGIGTAVTLTKTQEHILPPAAPLDPPPMEDRQVPGAGGDEPPPASPTTAASAVAAAAAAAARVSPSPAKICSLPAICRRSSDSDLSITPKGNSLTGSDRSSTAGLQLRPPPPAPRTALNQESLDMMEYPFLTMTKYPPGFILHIGGLVNARSVKLLERISNLEEPESRDAWWTELRMEVRSHARALCCNVVLGYEETTSICDDVCVLSAAGTAAVVASGPADPLALPATAPAPTAAPAHAQSPAQQATPQQQPVTAASALASAGPSPAQAPPPAPPQPPAAAAALPAALAHVVPAAPAAALSSTSLDREVWSPQQERERDRSTPQRASSLASTAPAPSLSGAAGGAFADVASQPLSMAGKARHSSDGGGGAADEAPGVAGGLGGSGHAHLQAQCAPCHLPYSEASVPFRVCAARCGICRRHKVPELLYTSIEPPDGLATLGRGALLQAYVCRPKRDMGRGELNAKEISDGLPFLEYELHRSLSYKLRLRGMNAIFGLRVQVAIGERLMVALASGTACCLPALPPAPVPKVTAGNSWTEDAALADTQRQIQEAVRRAREAYGLPPAPRTTGGPNVAPASAPVSNTASTIPTVPSVPSAPTALSGPASDTDDSEDDLPDLDLSAGNKDACVFEIDDTEDMEVVRLLLEPPAPEGFQACTTEMPPGMEESELAPGPQMFTHVWRARLGGPATGTQGSGGQGPAARALHTLCARLLRSLFFKLRRAAPAALTRLRFRVQLPDADEIQISVLGMALGVVEAERPPLRGRRKVIAQSCSRELISSRRDESDLIFSLEEDQVGEAAPAGGGSPPAGPPSAVSTVPTAPGRPLARTFQSLRISSHGGGWPVSAAAPAGAAARGRFGVDISPLSYTPGGRIERYLGNLNFFFIRESTSIREAGGLSGFVHSFACEVLAIVRSHVTALGGNAMVAYFMSECVLYHNPHKNQGQCLINVGGDVVYVTYDD